MVQVRKHFLQMQLIIILITNAFYIKFELVVERNNMSVFQIFFTFKKNFL